MKINKATKILLIVLGITACISIIGIRTIVVNNREQARQLEKDKLEDKIANLEAQLKDKEKDKDNATVEKDTTTTEKKNICKEDPECTIEEAHDHTQKEEAVKPETVKPETKVSAMDMLQNAINDNSYLAVNRFYNYYIAVYTAIQNNYNNYSAKDMYEVADKFLNILYGDIKDHGALTDELLQSQRDWVDYKVNNYNKNDYAGLYTYTMNRCYEFIEMYK